MTHEEGFGRESIRLHIHVCVRHLVHEGRLAYIRVSGEDERSRGWVDGGKTSQVLTDLLEVLEGRLELLDGCHHSTEGSSLELLALVKGFAELEQFDVILRDGHDDVSHGIHLTQSDLKVISVVKDVHEIGIEGVNIVQSGKLIHNLLEFFAGGLLSELHLSHVKLPNTNDVEVGVDHSRRLSHGTGEDRVDQVIRGKDGLNRFPVVDERHGS
jgi:hypothetical protein